MSLWHVFECLLSDEFWAARNGKRLSFWLFRKNLRKLVLFHSYFVCKCSFIEITILIIIIFENSKIQNFKIARLLFIKTEIIQVYNPFQKQILQILCSIIIIVRWILKKLPKRDGRGKRGTVLIFSWNCNYQHLLGYPSILLGYSSNIHTCMPFNGSWCVISLT